MIQNCFKNPFCQLLIGGLLLIVLDWVLLTQLFPIENRIIPFHELHVLGIGFGLFLLTSLHFLAKVNTLILGYVYLILTFIELVIGFVVGQPIKEQVEGMNPEKAVFLIVFLLYLTLQTYASTRIINRT